ncbi:MAG: DUF4190 domain-containing protein [Candidatus Pacearchaeota archaeon]|nr:DUF4190 domain-containing protein [Candidatus Pacearchaeota archaeon]
MPKKTQKQAKKVEQEKHWNTLAILGFIFAFIFNIVGLILSIIALVQINKSHEKGKGLAIAGLILSIIFVILTIIIVLLVLLTVGLVHSIGSLA